MRDPPRCRATAATLAGVLSHAGRLTRPVLWTLVDGMSTVLRCFGWVPAPRQRQSAQSTATARAPEDLPHVRLGQPSEPLDEDRD